MGGIEKLKEFSIKEIQDKTFIDAIYVESILNKDTEALARINKTKLNGFLNILEREYNISLEDMRGDFIVTRTKDEKNKNRVEVGDIKDETKNKKKKKVKKTTEIKVDIDKSSGKVFLNTERNSNDKRIIFSIILLGIIIYGYYYFTNLNMVPSEDNSSDLIKLSEVDTLLENNDTKDTQQDELFVGTGVEALKNKDVNESVIKDKNTTANSLAEKEEIVADNNQTKQEVKKIKNISILAKKGRVWIGILYLDTLKRDSKTIKKFNIDLARNQLIVTGHGLFNLSIDGNKTKYNKQTKVRFLYKDNNFTEISKTKYEMLGKGKAW